MEIVLISIVALVVVGPQKLPAMLRTVGEWMGKLRRLTTEVRAQTGIDEILRSEGVDGGLSELRSIMRGDLRGIARGPSPKREETYDDPYEEASNVDDLREYPLEGADAHNALPDDLVDEDEAPALPAKAAIDAAPTGEHESVTPRSDDTP